MTTAFERKLVSDAQLHKEWQSEIDRRDDIIYSDKQVIADLCKPQMFDMLHGRYLCFDPKGRWHGWEFYKHPDGQFVSIAKRECTEPFSTFPWATP